MPLFVIDENYSLEIGGFPIHDIYRSPTQGQDAVDTSTDHGTDGCIRKIVCEFFVYILRSPVVDRVNKARTGHCNLSDYSFCPYITCWHSDRFINKQQGIT